MKRSKKILISMAILFLAILAACMFVFRSPLLQVFAAVTGRVVIIDGPSMEPTLMDGDKIMISKGNNNLQRGDIVIYKDETGGSRIHRIVGLPGETIELKDDSVFIDGTQLAGTEFTHILSKPISTRNTTEYILGDDEFFVLGDNTTYARDSRYRSKNLHRSMITGVFMRKF